MTLSEPIVAREESFTLGQIRALMPGFARMLDRNSSDYATFLAVFYDELDEALVHLERNRKIRLEDSEDRTTEEIIGILNATGYNASHDSSRSGHCDIVVLNSAKLEWLGEAKIHSSYDYLYKGFQQLCTRYSTATHRSAAGGIIIYIRAQNAAAIVAEWRKRLGDQGLPKYVDENCSRRNELAFYSTHIHATSGLNYTVRHMAVIMGFSPKDTGDTTKLT